MIISHLACWQQASRQTPLSRSLASQQARSLAGETQAASFPPQPNSSRQCCLIWLFALAPSAWPSPGAMPSPGCDAQPPAVPQGRLLVLRSSSSLHLWVDIRVTRRLHSAAAEHCVAKSLTAAIPQPGGDRWETESMPYKVDFKTLTFRMHSRHAA